MSIDLRIATKIKKNDTFSGIITVRREGIVIDLTGIAITSSMRSVDGLFSYDLTVTPHDLVNGQVKVRGDTGTWPEGVLKWDVQFVENGDTWSTPTRGVEVTEDNTS